MSDELVAEFRLTHADLLAVLRLGSGQMQRRRSKLAFAVLMVGGAALTVTPTETVLRMGAVLAPIPEAHITLEPEGFRAQLRGWKEAA